MGLSSRRTKQRIGADPRNLTWSDDSSKFGAKYLQSLGWTSGSGLGMSGEGRKGNLKIHQKLDFMGIGANRRDMDDAGWKVGRDFDGLLARLNESQNADSHAAVDDKWNKVDESTGPLKTEEMYGGENSGVVGVKKVKQTEKGVSDQKRKRLGEQDDEQEPKSTKRRRKEEKERVKADKKMSKKTSKKHSEPKEDAPDESTIPASAVPVTIAPGYRAHRARHIASKRLAAASTTSMNEILGISPSSVSGQTQGPSVLVNPCLGTDVVDEDQIPAPGLESCSSFGGGLGFRGKAMENPNCSRSSATEGDLLRKSEKSMAAYFAEKMRMRGVAKERTTS